MMRSMYSAISGLRNHQMRMDVIGNNIANVNTTGFKKSRVVFKDTLYQNIRGASRANDTRGGTNPMGIGLGMTLSSIDQIHTPSPATTTNKTTDMAIDGNGYFVLANGDVQYYTRAGAFDFDEWGNLISTSNGYLVMGWVADRDNPGADGNWSIDTTKAPAGIDLSSYRMVNPRATTRMEFTGNVDSNLDSTPITDPTAGTFPTDAEQTIITSKDVYDSLGNKITLYFRFFKYDVDDTTGDSIWACDICQDPDFENMTNADGTSAYTPGDDFGAVDLSNPTELTNPTKIIRAYNLKFNTKGEISKPTEAQIDIKIPRTDAGAEEMNVTIDFSQLTQFNAKSTAWAEYQDGYTKGDLNSISVGTDGTITGVYSNGESRTLARVAIANFQNPSGLLQVGNSMFQVSNNSGDARIGAPGEEGMGTIIPGSLEMSNVDISEEFTDMIVTQRGFQANSRIITTSDEMLQELVNLKR
ncbi:MAG: flagellar hook protein FlgE [Syntrophomonadaceae bacterium]|jgi:flagellar hook protein FlgE